jgi:uncharacterized protein YfiM (DUF2279 family)
MRAVLATLFVLLILVIGGVVALVAYALEDAPRVTRAVEIGPDQVARAKRILEGHHPSRRRDGALSSVTLAPDDADLALNYLVGRFARGSAQLALADQAATITLSVPLPANPLGAWLNLEVGVAQAATLPVVTSLRVGAIPIPAVLARFTGAHLLDAMRAKPEARVNIDVLQGVRLGTSGVTVIYQWSDDLPDRVRTAVGSPEQRDRLRAYQARLAAMPGGTVSLTALFGPLMALAAERSVSGDPVAENQAAIVVLTMHVLGKPLELIEPAAAAWPKARRGAITLAGRDDFPKHFMVSAALSALAGTALADAVGLYKEIEDSRGGSGFSFNDIAADRAGTRFGEQAVDTAGAGPLQVRVAAGVREADVLPPTADLPEFLAEAEFKARFGGVGAPAYQRMMDDIERRIAALPALR